MNYQRIYNEFIADRRANPVTDGYTEHHHIIPGSMDGSDDKSNLIRLTAGDHFFAHICLAKIFGGIQWAGVYAMANLKGSSKKRNIYTSRKMVEVAREKMAEMSSKNAIEQHKDKNYREIMTSDAVNAKRSASMMGRPSALKGKTQSAETKRRKKIGITAYWNSETGISVKNEKRKAWNENNPNDNPESRAKITTGIKAYRARPEIKEMYSRTRMRENNPMYGKSVSNETRRKISESMIGKRHTQATKDKMSKSQKGKIVSQETRDKLSKSLKGKKMTSEQKRNHFMSLKRGKDHPNSRMVTCIETRETFDTARNAAKFINASDGSEIGKVCKGKAKTAGGYHWKFA